MSEKPSYLGLLNAVANGEGAAGQYLSAWAAVTPSDDVRAVLNTIALRESEHSLAFTKRIDELGYAVIPKPDSKQAGRMAIAGSTALSDKEKFEALGLCRRPTNGTADVFDSFFANKDLDAVTGGLLGRYVAEERDSGRRFADCYDLLCAAEQPAPKKGKRAKSS